MLQAMNTGHDGSLSTVHANAPRDALARIETMVLMAGFDLPSRAIREQIASALNLVVHIERFRDGAGVVANVTEVLGMEGEVITMQDVFKYDCSGQHHPAHRHPPAVHRSLHDHGITLPRGCSSDDLALRCGASSPALFILVLMALPGRRVSKSRLGIEREPLESASSMDGVPGAARQASAAGPGPRPGRHRHRSRARSCCGSAGVRRCCWRPGRCSSARCWAWSALVVPYLVARSWVSYKGAKRQDAVRGAVARHRSSCSSRRCGPASASPRRSKSLTEEAEEPTTQRDRAGAGRSPRWVVDLSDCPARR